MRREEGLVAACDAERALQLRPGGHERRRAVRQRQRRRNVPARAAHRKGGAHDRVLAAPVDRAVVGEERVGDPTEPLARILVVERDRLVRAVAAGEHERPAQVCAKQMVERRVGQHQAEPRCPGCDRWSDGRPPAPAHEHDRSRRRAQQLELGRRELCQLPGRVGQEREGLLLAVLAPPEPRDRVLVACVTGEVVAADPLDRDDLTRGQQRHRLV